MDNKTIDLSGTSFIYKLKPLNTNKSNNINNNNNNSTNNNSTNNNNTNHTNHSNTSHTYNNSTNSSSNLTKSASFYDKSEYSKVPILTNYLTSNQPKIHYSKSIPILPSIVYPSTNNINYNIYEDAPYLKTNISDIEKRKLLNLSANNILSNVSSNLYKPLKSIFDGYNKLLDSSKINCNEYDNFIIEDIEKQLIHTRSELVNTKTELADVQSDLFSKTAVIALVEAKLEKARRFIFIKTGIEKEAIENTLPKEETKDSFEFEFRESLLGINTETANILLSQLNEMNSSNIHENIEKLLIPPSPPSTSNGIRGFKEDIIKQIEAENLAKQVEEVVQEKIPLTRKKTMAQAAIDKSNNKKKDTDSKKDKTVVNKKLDSIVEDKSGSNIENKNNAFVKKKSVIIETNEEKPEKENNKATPKKKKKKSAKAGEAAEESGDDEQ